MFTVTCPLCTNKFTAAESQLGQVCTCLHCGRKIQLPALASPPPPPPQVQPPPMVQPPPIPPPLPPPPPSPPPPVQSRAGVSYDHRADVFSGSLSQVMRLAVKAVHDVGYKLDNANETLGILTFQTGMSWGSWSGVSCSLAIEEVQPERFRVTGTGKQNVSGGQLVAINFFGEAQKRAGNVIERMKELAS